MLPRVAGKTRTKISGFVECDNTRKVEANLLHDGVGRYFGLIRREVKRSLLGITALLYGEIDDGLRACGHSVQTNTKVSWTFALEWCILVSGRLSRKGQSGESGCAAGLRPAKGGQTLGCVLCN